MPQLLKVDVDNGFSKLASWHLHEFMKQYVWKITTGMVFFIPFDLNVHHSVYDPRAKFLNWLQDFEIYIIIQLIKGILCMHAERFQKLENVYVIYPPPVVADTESLSHFNILNCKNSGGDDYTNVILEWLWVAEGGYSIGYVVLITSRAVLQADSYQGVVPTNIEKETVTNPGLPYNFSSRPVIHYINIFNIAKTNTNHCGNVDSERLDERSLGWYKETWGFQFVKYRVNEIC